MSILIKTMVIIGVIFLTSSLIIPYPMDAISTNPVLINENVNLDDSNPYYGNITLPSKSRVIDTQIALGLCQTTLTNTKSGLRNATTSNLSFSNDSWKLSTYNYSISSAEYDEDSMTNVELFDGKLRLQHTQEFQYSQPIRVDHSGNASYKQIFPSMAVDGHGHIFVAWMGMRNGEMRIFFSRSLDNGFTFSEEYMVEASINDNSFQAWPHLICDRNGYLHLVWYVQDDLTHYGARYSNSNDTGASFLPSVPTNMNMTNSISVSADQTIYLSESTYYTSSYDNGRTFSDIKRMDNLDNNTLFLDGGNTALDDMGNIYGTFCTNNGTSTNEVYYAYSNDSGLTFKCDKISNGYEPYILPLENGNANIVWWTNDAIHISEIQNETSVEITNHSLSTVALYGAVSDKDGDIDLVWPNNGIIHATYCKNGTWIERRVHDSGGYPQIAEDINGTIHIVYAETDGSSGDNIYYVQGKEKYHTNGSIMTQPFFINYTPITINFSYSLDDQKNGTIEVLYRGSNDNVTWSDWKSGQYIRNGLGRYVQFKLILMSNESIDTPIIYGYEMELSFYSQKGVIDFPPVGYTTIIKSLLVHLDADWTGETVSFDISYDQENNWSAVTPDELYLLTEESKSLRYRIILSSDGNDTPSVQDYEVILHISLYPQDLSFDIGCDGTIEWIWNGTPDSNLRLPDFSTVFNDYIMNYTNIHQSDYVTIPYKIFSLNGGECLIKEFIIQYDSPPNIITRYPDSNRISISEGASINLSLNVLDSDFDSISYMWFINGHQMNESKNTFEFTTDYSSAGQYIIIVHISDHYFSINESWDVDVINVNRHPVIDTYTPKLKIDLVSGEQQLFSVVSHDPDLDVLYYSWFVNNIIQNQSTNQFTLQTENLETGNHIISIRMSDGNSTTSMTWNVKIKEAIKNVDELWNYSGLALIIILFIGLLAFKATRKKRLHKPPP